jgi:hypothetical protein
MATVSLTCHGELNIGGRVYKFGSQHPQEFTVTGDNVMDRQVDVAASATVLVWSAAIDLPASFAWLILTSDQDLVLEFITDDDDSIGEEIYTVTLAANAPLILASDASYANYTVNFGAGTLDLIESIRAKNLGGTDAILNMLIVD